MGLLLFIGMNWIRMAGILGFVGVALGAFGAHALKAKLSEEMLRIWNTAVLYHLVHALVLLALALYAKGANQEISWGARFFLAGILIFSGSLYALSLSGIKVLGAITPLGGICFLLGWGWIAFKLSNRA
jgi:uncharacterized membrane protein YgdD (TMEM256/DUF423 family)